MQNKLKIRIKKQILLLGVLVILLFTVTACQQLDVIGNGSVTSFEKVLNAIPENVSKNDDGLAWSLEAPDGSARFIWSEDFSKTNYDAMIEFDSEPFLLAGLDLSLLPSEMIQDDKIIVGIDFGDTTLSYSGSITPIASYEQIVRLKRDHIGHHADMDHYGIDIGNGNKFEWAKDMNANDKDIVFVIDPDIFIKAGVNPNDIEEWAFAKVKTMDSNGKEIEVDKFLKPFNLN